MVSAACLLVMALACSDDPNCQDECAPFEEELENILNESEVPCDSLGDGACQRSGRCVMDSICAGPACSGAGCSSTCELVRACVPY
jgi:hypothetical protein